MTNLDALKTETEGLGLSEDKLKLLLTNRGLSPDGEYTPNQKGFDLAYAYALVDVLKRPKSWSQGDMSETWDFDSLKDIATAIFNKYKAPNPFVIQPKIRFIR